MDVLVEDDQPEDTGLLDADGNTMPIDLAAPPVLSITAGQPVCAINCTCPPPDMFPVSDILVAGIFLSTTVEGELFKMGTPTSKDAAGRRRIGGLSIVEDLWRT